jgi:hypothetical protein
VKCPGYLSSTVNEIFSGYVTVLEKYDPGYNGKKTFSGI